MAPLSIAEFDQYLSLLGGSSGLLALTGVVAATAFYFMTRPKRETPIVPLHEQSWLLPGPEMIRVSKLCTDFKNGHILTFVYDDVRTLYDSFLHGVKASGNSKCLGWREGSNKPYLWQSYNETLQRAMNFGSGLVCLGLSPGQKTFVGIYAKNCPEWVMAELASYCYSMIIVPLYDTLGAEACGFIINQTEMSLVVCEDDNKASLLLNQTPRSLKLLVMIREASPSIRQQADLQGVQVINFRDVEIQGADKNHPCVIPKPDDFCTINYTSGTTGVPKGVMLTHTNVVSCVSSTVVQLSHHQPTKNDILISILPLAHIYERYFQHAVYTAGGAVGFFGGDIQRLGEDLVALKPTLMVVVPRLLNKVYDKTMAEVSKSKIKKLLLNLALASKDSEINKGIVRTSSVWDKVVFRKVREAMGGRVRLMIVGSAPLAGNVLRFMRCALGCQLIVGYGQTECTGPVTCTIVGDCEPEQVGPPIACNRVKLVDVPEMGYYAAQNQGEVCVQGTNVTKGYYKEPEKSQEIIDEDSWLHTGDIGEWLPNGTLKIIDRKKHIFKLSQGEYIAPEKIENIYISSQYVEQIFVHGESLKSCIIAIVVPVVDVITSWASSNGITASPSALCKDNNVKKLIMEDLQRLGRNAGLKSFEQVKDIYLHPEPFTSQNGLLTPTMKSKRPEVKDYFKKQISQMYNKLE